MQVSMDRVSAGIAEIAETEALSRFRKLSDDEIRDKGKNDLVTIADVAVEKALTDFLTDLLPGSSVVGEEAVAADRRVLERLNNPVAPVWVIDPIDGTGNYARGVERFAVMVALVQDNEAVAAWILDPVTGEMTSAEKGSGAFCAGRRLAVSDNRPLTDLRGSIHASTFASKALAAHMDTRRSLVRQLKSYSCAGHEYIRLGQADADFSFFSRTMPWDHVPGVLIHAEAGGYTRLAGKRAYLPSNAHASGLLIASSEESWNLLHEAFFGNVDLSELF